MPPEDAGEEEVNGPPPHPLDRPWVHPSELFASGRPPATPRVRTRRGIRPRDLVLALGAGIIGALAMVVVLALAGLLSEQPRTVAVTRATDQPDERDSAARLAAAANHSVVGIVAATPMGARKLSGVFVRDGEVITSASAIDGATSLTVVDGHGSKRAGEVVGVDPSTRLALIRVDGGSSPAKLAANSELEVGQWILALGGTDGSGPRVATGVIASLGGWSEDGSGATNAGMITVDAVLPPEANGGALLDRKGHVVGILAGATKDAMAALATPIATVRNVAAQLAATGKADHGALGVRITDNDSPRGARVLDVTAGSAADDAGIATGDVLVKLADEPIRSAAELVVAVRLRKPGERLPVTVVRKGDSERVTVTLDAVVTAPPSSTTVPAQTISTG
jgi:putative serine protease PepD